MTTCPGCNRRLESTAIVAAFLDDPQWSFWGVEGCRWIVCRAAGYVHFRVQIDGRMYHRLARITKTAQVAPTLFDLHEFLAEAEPAEVAL